MTKIGGISIHGNSGCSRKMIMELASTERTELVPVVAARENTTEAEYDDEKQGSSQWETKCRPARHMVHSHGRGRGHIGTVH